MSNFITSLLKNEFRTIIALGILLLVLVSYGIAADNQITYKFDFGDGQGIAAGHLPIDGNASPYPISDGVISYGWVGGVIEKSSGAAVEDLRKRDSNTGVSQATFKVSGLTDGPYSITIISGDLDDSFSTTVLTSNQSYMIKSLIGSWETFTFNTVVFDGDLNLIFKRSGADIWGVNALVISSIDVLPPSPIFDVAIIPEEHTIKSGGTVIYEVSVTPLNNYANTVTLSVMGLVNGMTSNFTPASGVPPFKSDLTITTSKTNISTYYDLIVNIKGDDLDKYTINQAVNLIITDFPPDKVDDTNPTDSSKPNLDELIDSGEGFVIEDAIEIQKKIDEFVRKVQDEQLSTKSELESLNDIALINDLILFTNFPIPKTSTEAALLYLTETGIIQSVVDTAPPIGEYKAPARPPGLFERLLGVFAGPVN